MKHLILVAGFATSLALPVLAQPGGPIQLRNPHRGGPPMGGGGFGGGFPGMGSGAPANGDFGGNMPTAPATPPAPPSVAMFADGAYLFVLRGDTLFQFDKKTLKLINSAELPRPVAPTPAPATTTPQDDVRTQTSPPLRPGANFKIGPTF